MQTGAFAVFAAPRRRPFCRKIDAMVRRTFALLSVACAFFAACSGTYSGESPADAGRDTSAPAPDASPTDASDAALADAAAPPPCDLDGPFVTIEPVAGLNTTADDVGLAITNDGLGAIVVVANVIDGSYGRSFFRSSRASTASPWEKPVPLPGFGTVGVTHDNPSFTGDGKAFFFEYNTSNGLDIVWMPHEPGGAFDVALAKPVVGIASPAQEFDSYVARDGKSLYFASDRSGKRAVYRAQLDERREASRVNLLLGISINGTEQDPIPTPDDQTLYFSRWLPREAGGTHPDIFVSKRGANGEYETSTPVTEIDTDGLEYAVDISNDGCTLYFTTDGRRDSIGGVDIYAAKKAARADR